MQQHCEERNNLSIEDFLKLSWRSSQNSPSTHVGEQGLRPMCHYREFQLLGPGLAEPVLEAGLGQSGIVAGQECALAKFYVEVARVRIGDHFAWIAAFPRTRRMSSSRRNCCGSRHFNDAVEVAILRSSWQPHSRHPQPPWVGSERGATRTVLPSVASSAILLMNSKNCVA